MGRPAAVGPLLLLRRSNAAVAAVVLPLNLLCAAWAATVVSTPWGGESPLWLLAPGLSAVLAFGVVATEVPEVEAATSHFAVGTPTALRLTVACALTCAACVPAVLGPAPGAVVLTWCGVYCLLGAASAAVLRLFYWFPLLAATIVQLQVLSRTAFGGELRAWTGEPAVPAATTVVVAAGLLALWLRCASRRRAVVLGP